MLLSWIVFLLSLTFVFAGTSEWLFCLYVMSYWTSEMGLRFYPLGLVLSYSHPPQTRGRWLNDSEFGSQIKKRSPRQRFSEDISELKRSRDVLSLNQSKGNLFTDVVEVSVKMLRSIVQSWVCTEIHGWEIVAVKKHWTELRDIEVLEKSREPREFLSSSGQSFVFSFCRWFCDCRLSLGRLQNGIISKKNAKSSRGASGFFASCPVAVTVSHEYQVFVLVNLHCHTDCSLYVS